MNSILPKFRSSQLPILLSIWSHSMNTTIETTILSRLEKLEHQNKRLKLLLWMVPFAAFTVISSIGWVAQDQFFKVISAEKFVLKDAQGRERAVLGIDTTSTSLKFINTEGNESTKLVYDSDMKFSALQMFDSAGNVSSALVSMESENLLAMNNKDKAGIKLTCSDLTKQLQLFDDEGELGTVLYDHPMMKGLEFYDRTTPAQLNEYGTYSFGGGAVSLINSAMTGRNLTINGNSGKQTVHLGHTLGQFGESSVLQLSDTSGNGLITLAARRDGKTARISISTRDKKDRVAMGTGEDNSSYIGVIGAKGQWAASMFSYFNGVSSLDLADYQGNDRVSLFINKDNNPYMNLKDGGGKVRAVTYLNDGKPAFELYDGNGNKRTVIGCTSTINSSKQSVSHPESSIWLFNEYGNSIWTNP